MSIIYNRTRVKGGKLKKAGFWSEKTAFFSEMTHKCRDISLRSVKEGFAFVKDTLCRCGRKFSHSLVTELLSRATGWRESECQAPDESTPVAGGPLKIHQATSGIMSGIALMCESRKERSDGIAHCYGKAVNRVECPFAQANEGKHVRKGWLFT
jgi:hypothetical protein